VTFALRMALSPLPQIILSTQGDMLMDSATPEIETMGEAEQTEPFS